MEHLAEKDNFVSQFLSKCIILLGLFYNSGIIETKL